jgi:hypothetical protein
MADNNYIPQVDYTSRDYAALRQDLIDLIPYYAPQWTNRDSADFGITLIELFSYIGDNLNYYIDRTANESFIDTASQRESVLQIARLLGYSPTKLTAATCTLTFQNSTASVITVPALTKCAATVTSNGITTQIYFETDSAVVVPAKVASTNGSATVKATQGETKSETIGVSDGKENQSFELTGTDIIAGSIKVTINGVVYTEVPYLVDYSGYSPVFTTYTNEQGTTFITFGDNVSGRIPLNGKTLVASYRVGGGSVGNVSSGGVKYIVTNAVAGLTVANQDIGLVSGAATGGAEPESVDSIRINAPKSIRALNRAVSLSDYSSLVIQVSGVAKAISVADVFTSITVYFAPYGDSGLQSDGVTSSLVFNNLATTVYEYLIDKIPAGTTVSLQPPTYVNVQFIANIVVLPQYRQDQVLTDVKAAVATLLDFDNVLFNDRINISDFYSTINGVEGVARGTISKLVRSDQEQSFVITNKVATATKATLTTSVNHNLVAGQTVLIDGADTTLKGIFVISEVTTNTFSFQRIGAIINTAAYTGSVTVLNVTDIICKTNELPRAGTISITAAGGITV